MDHLLAAAVDNDDAAPLGPATADAVLAHPVYGSLGWVAVINPGERTTSLVLDLIARAHADARRRAERRSEL